VPRASQVVALLQGEPTLPRRFREPQPMQTLLLLLKLHWQVWCLCDGRGCAVERVESGEHALVGVACG
jgi:hypothetical protein